MYDVEALSQKTRTSNLELGSMVSSKKEAKAIGDCDEKDFSCQNGEDDTVAPENASVSELKHVQHAIQHKAATVAKHAKSFADKMRESTHKQAHKKKHHHKKARKHRHHHRKSH